MDIISVVMNLKGTIKMYNTKTNNDNDNDNVNHPPHYKQHPSGIECIQITEHMTFNLGNATKYIWRAGLKSANPIEDLKKAAWYIQREIELLTKIWSEKENKK